MQDPRSQQHVDHDKRFTPIDYENLSSTDYKIMEQEVEAAAAAAQERNTRTHDGNGNSKQEIIILYEATVRTCGAGNTCKLIGILISLIVLAIIKMVETVLSWFGE